MILILSQTSELTTDYIIDWIDYLGVPFKRMNGIDFYQRAKIHLTNAGLQIQVQDVDWTKINAVWLRRWMSMEDAPAFYVQSGKDSIDPIRSSFNQFVKSELNSLAAFFFDSIPTRKLFSRTRAQELNKLVVLKKACELDILIPDTYILNSRKGFDALSKEKGLITKAIMNGPSIHYRDDCFLGYTSMVDELPEELGESYCPSLFQAMVKKKYEIRAFLLNGKFYSMAIFSQQDQQTQVDFRMYNYKEPNRTVPYQLPQELERKLIEPGDYFGLKTGSFDIIKTNDNQHVFLEVNPGGQFGMVSYPCNYHLEREMAMALINLDESNEN